MRVRGPLVQNGSSSSSSRADKPHGAHVSIAGLSLPPGVSGDVKGELVACVEALHWKYRQPPAQVQVRICWWGAAVGTDTVVPFHARRGAGAAFPVTSGPRFLVRYLRDMGSLTVSIEECPNGRTIGTLSMDTSNVDVTRPLVASVPCLGANKQVLATADVSLRIHYSQLLSSFEMAEHLASADKALPLYPVTDSRRQATAQGTATAAAVLPGTASAAAAVDSAAMHGNSSTRRHPAAETDRTMQQQLAAGTDLATDSSPGQQPEPAVAVAAARTAEVGCAALPSMQEQEGTSAAAAAAGRHGEGSYGDQPMIDPLLEVIKKAEQLKASLDQAAQAGILLALPSLQHQAWHQQQQQQLIMPQLLHALPQAQPLPPARPRPGNIPLANSLLDGWGAGSLLLGQPPASAGRLPATLSPLSHTWGVQSSATAPAAEPPAAVAAGLSPNRESRSLLTGSELLAALAGSQAFPSGATAGASLRPTAVQRRKQHKHHRRSSKHHAEAAAVSSSDAGIGSPPSSPSSSSSSQISSGQSSSCGSSLLAELDDLEELEDLLLQELLSMRSPPTAARHKAAGKGKHRHKSAQQQQQAADKVLLVAQAGEGAQDTGPVELPDQQQQQPSTQEHQAQGCAAAAAEPSGPQLFVELLSLSGLDPAPPAVTAVLKCAGQKQQLDVTRLAQQGAPQRQQEEQHEGAAVEEGLQGAAAADGVQHACSTTMIAPAALQQPALLATQRPCLVVEVWSGSPVTTPAAAAASDVAAADTPRLLGIVRVPLHHPQQQQADVCRPDSRSHLHAAAAAGDLQCLATGTYPVYDVLRGQAVGSLELRVVLLPEAAGAVVPETAPALQGTQQTAGGTHSMQQQAAAAVSPAVVAVRHVIDVTLVSASGLPGAADLDAAQQLVPDKRFFKYSFPGDEPLYTQEVDCVSAPVLAAHARHTVLLQPGETVAECFSGDGSSETALPEQLDFEVFDKWADDTDSLAAVGSLPLQQVLDLCQPTPPSSPCEEDGGTRTATFLVQLALPPASVEAAGQPPGRTVLLQVAVSYSSSPCYGLDEHPAVAADMQHGQVVQEQQQDDAAGAQQQSEDVSEQAAEPGAQEPPGQPAHDMPGSENGSSSNDEYPSIQLFDEQHVAVEGTAASGGAQAAAGLSAEAAADTAAADACSEEVPRVAAPSAELCVKVVRACGLQAAVKEAEGWLGNASGLLGRARQLGPHPYVTVALFPGNNAVPTIKAPFQAQTFCPQFHYQQVLPLTLNAATLSALASTDASVELWHHCPRSQAVAAALSRGLSSSYAMNGQQQVFLGSHSLPLQGLLTRPQGIRCWLVLKSQLGVPVGAVQLEVSFTHIGGTPVDTCPTALSPLARHPDWLQLLPAAPAQRLSGFAALPPPGFNSQWVRCSLHLEELLLPGGDDAALERPKVANYMATFRLPGSQQEGSTHPKACSSHAAGSNLLARSWRVDWRSCSHVWGVADARLAMALLGYPLVVTVAKQEPSKQQQAQAQGLMLQGKGQAPGGSGSGVMGAAASAVIPCGSVEVDLSPLLATRPGSSAPSCRWLSGTHTVIHPMSKSLGNMRLRLKVVLELSPHDAPSPAWFDSHPGALWQVSGPLATLTEAPAPPTAPAAATTSAAARVAATAELAQHAAATQAEPARADAATQASDEAALDKMAGVSTATEPGGLSSQGVADHSSSNSSSSHGSLAAAGGLRDPDIAAGACGGDAAAPAGSTAGATSGASGPAADHAASQLGLKAGGPRLRAEVSHVPAPPGAISPGSAAAAAQHSPERPSPQQSQLVLVPAAANPVQEMQQAHLAQQLQLQTARDKLCDVRVCVECALNLELHEFTPGFLPVLYVRYDWPGCGAVTTPLVDATSGPLGGAHSAKWFHCVHLPLALQPDRQQQEQRTAQPTAAGSGGGGAAMVLFQVWCRAVPAAVAAELPPLYSGLCAAPVASDALLGYAALDLAALQLLGAIDGWYNILDMQQQARGQIKVSLTPQKQLDAPLQVLSQSADSLQQVLAAGTMAPAALSAPTTAAMLESSLSQLQQHLDNLTAQSGQQQTLEVQQTDFADLLHGFDASSNTRALAVDQLSDVAFMALAAESTAAAEAAAAAVEAAASAGKQAAQSDSLLDTLRTNLEELDKLSAALAVRIGRCDNKILPPGVLSSTRRSSSSSMPIPAGIQGGDAAGAGRAEPASAPHHQPFRHVRTLSDDEDYLVAASAVTESDVDTEELIGRVDWSLAANSDDDHDVPPGPPQRQQQQQPSRLAASTTDTRPLSGSVLQQPLNTEDWMFDIGRPSRASSAAAAAAATTAAGPSGGSSLSARSSQLPVHPGQMTPAQAEAVSAASAARLAQVDAAAATAAARRAAAAATRHGSKQAPPTCTHPADAEGQAPPARAADMWDQLAQLEAEEEAAARQRRQQQRQQQQQQQQHRVAQHGAVQQQQQQLHDPRSLPDELESRLDLLLSEFQVSASGPGAYVGRAATGPLQQFGSYSAQAAAAAAFGRLEGAGAWHSDDFDAAGGDSDDSGDFLPVERVVHQSREEPQQTEAGSRGHGGSGRGADEGERLPGVGFANALPPVQEDFVLEYSDGPPQARAMHRQQQEEVLQPPQQQAPPQPPSSAPSRNDTTGGNISSSSSSQRVPGYGSRTAAPISRTTGPPAATTPSATAQQTAMLQAAAAASAAGATTAAGRLQEGGGSSTGFTISTTGRRPVGGGPAAYSSIDDMFSISRRPAGSARSSSSSTASGGIKHPGM